MFKINVSSLDEVVENHRQYYEPDPDKPGAYRLQTSDLEGLRSSLRKLKEKVLKLSGKAYQDEPLPVNEQLSPREKFIRENAHRLAGLDDEARNAMIVSILDEAAPLIDAEIREYVASQESRLNVVRDNVRRLTIESEARKILADVAVRGSENTLLPHVLKRLTASENEGGEFQLSVVDVDGKPMSMSIEDLKDEFRHTPAFAPVVRGADSSEQVSHARKVALALGEPPPSMKAH